MLLPDEQIEEIGNSSDHAIGVVKVKNHLVILRGNLMSVVVPFEWFTPSGTSGPPDFSDPKVGDWGHSIVLGPSYEASFRAILDEFC